MRYYMSFANIKNLEIRPIGVITWVVQNATLAI